MDRLLQPFEGFSKEEEVSFRWDPANLRWAKSKGKLAEDADMMITPLIGEPYMVNCVIPQLPLAEAGSAPGNHAQAPGAGMACGTQLPAKKEAQDNQSRRGEMAYAALLH